MKLWQTVLWAAIFLGAAFPARGADEAQLRADFGKAYGSPDAAVRKAAVETLKGAQEKATWQMLFTVCGTDKDAEVRKAAFGALCEGKDPDGSRANIATLAFKNEKDREVKKELAAKMTGLEFRFEPLGELCAFVSTLRYPDLPDPSQLPPSGGGGGQSGGASAGNNTGATLRLVQQSREYFEAVLKALNALAGPELAEKFKPVKTSPQEVKSWWAGKSIEYQKLDAELHKKKAAEAAAANAAGGKKE